jgi:hypothetical protein
MMGILRLGFCDWEMGREGSTMGILRLGGGFYDGSFTVLFSGFRFLLCNPVRGESDGKRA